MIGDTSLLSFIFRGICHAIIAQVTVNLKRPLKSYRRTGEVGTYGGSWNTVGEVGTKEITGLFEDLHQS